MYDIDQYVHTYLMLYDHAGRLCWLVVRGVVGEPGLDEVLIVDYG